MVTSSFPNLAQPLASFPSLAQPLALSSPLSDVSRYLYASALVCNLLNQDDYWSICMNDIEIDGKPQNLCNGKCCKLVVDTGTL